MVSTLPGFNSLTAVRSSIGRAQSSVTCMLIQDTIYKDVNPFVVINMASMGLSMISDAMRDASMYYTMTNGYFGPKKMASASQGLAFIQGTSLEITITMFGINYDAEELRINFFRKFHVK